jgi:hypothetical protein
MFWRRSVADQVDEELDFHLEMVTRDLIARGWHEPDARAEARRRFGDLAEVGARCRKLGLEHERNVRRAESHAMNFANASVTTLATPSNGGVRLAARRFCQQMAISPVSFLALSFAASPRHLTTSPSE